MLITNVEKKPATATAKKHYRFTLSLNTYFVEEPIHIRGCRYWPDSGRVMMPTFKTGQGWKPVIIGDGFVTKIEGLWKQHHDTLVQGAENSILPPPEAAPVERGSGWSWKTMARIPEGHEDYYHGPEGWPQLDGLEAEAREVLTSVVNGGAGIEDAVREAKAKGLLPADTPEHPVDIAEAV